MGTLHAHASPPDLARALGILKVQGNAPLVVSCRPWMRWQPNPYCASSHAQATLCKLQALDALAACPLLRHLACAGNPLTALEPLPALASLAAQRCGVACLADLRPLALAPHLTRLALAGNPAVAGLSPRRRRVLIGNLLPGARLQRQSRCQQHAMVVWCWRCALAEC